MQTLFKPSGLPVFRPHVDPEGDCLVKHLLAEAPWRGAIAWPEGFDLGIAHRLDNATSGAVAVADDLEELSVIRSWFREGALVKTYRLVVARDPSWDSNRCAARLAHDARRRSRMVVERGPRTPHRGKWFEANTSFRRLQGRLFEATMTTGVMHQIRVHAAFLGIPLAGDRLYGGGSSEVQAFLLHHEGFVGPAGRTAVVPRPTWAETV